MTYPIEVQVPTESIFNALYAANLGTPEILDALADYNERLAKEPAGNWANGLDHIEQEVWMLREVAAGFRREDEMRREADKKSGSQ